MIKKITILLILLSANCFSQITIEKPKNKTQSNLDLKSLFNEKIDLFEFNNAEQFLGLVGKELFYLPKNSKYDFILDEYESISYIPRKKLKLGKTKYKSNELVKLSKWNKELTKFLELEESYLVVDSINFYDGVVYRKKIDGTKFNELQKNYLSNYSFNGSIDICTHHKKNNETILFTIHSKSDAEKLISVTYFNYLKSKYLDKKIILKKKGDKYKFENNRLSDFNRKYLDSTQIFKVTQVSLKEPESEYQKYYVPFFNLKNLYGDVEKLEFNNQIQEYLIFWEDFDKGADLKEKRDSIRRDSLKKVKLIKAKLKEEQLKLEKIDKEKRFRINKEIKQQKKIERHNKLVRKYGEEIGKIIVNSRVRIGMTKEMCKDSWGNPKSVNRTTTVYGTREQWVYGNGNYLYFEEDKLTSIQN